MEESLTKQQGDLYKGWGAAVRYVPFQADLIAEPDPACAPLPLLRYLGEEDAAVYSDAANMLLDDDELDLAISSLSGRYDTILGAHAQWTKYLNRPDVFPMFEMISE